MYGNNWSWISANLLYIFVSLAMSLVNLLWLNVSSLKENELELVLFLNEWILAFMFSCNTYNEHVVSTIKKYISHNFKYKESIIFKTISNCVIDVEISSCHYTFSCETSCNTLCSILLLDHCDNYSLVSI